MKRQELLGQPDGLVHGAVDNAALAPVTFMEANPAISTPHSPSYHLVMTNIAMENPNHKWRFLAGKIIYKWAIFHGYVK